MSLDLRETGEVLRRRFTSLREPRDVAHLLDVEYQSLIYWLYRQPEKGRYHQFRVPKKSSGSRLIRAPNRNLLILQRKLLQVLESVYTPKPVVFGFVSGRGHIQHAKEHLGRRYVLSTDIRDFFPSIHFGRVRGMLMGIPYRLPERVATLIAHLCCHDRELPQGAPTSPILSNMICAQMDSRLTQLAKRLRCTYSRYADDLTFSTNKRRFPLALAQTDESGQVEAGRELVELVEGSGFQLNAEKTRLIGRDGRQLVTGVVVNEKLNLHRRYRNRIRAMLHAWRAHGLHAAQRRFESHYLGRRSCPPGTPPPSFSAVLKGMIEYVGQVRGRNDAQYLRFLREYCECAGTPLPADLFPMAGLLRMYDALTQMGNPQRRGYELERLLVALLELEGLDVRSPFRRNSNGEQIDGAFVLGDTRLLVECRWRSQAADVAQVEPFRGKCERSESHGLFLSISGWSESVPHLLKQNPTKRIILMDGDDLASVLRERITLAGLVTGKLDTLRFDAEPFASASEICRDQSFGT